MTLPDDPRLTAYALGELDAAERAEIEARLANDPAAREWVADVRRIAGEVPPIAEPTAVATDRASPGSVRRRGGPALKWVAGVAAVLLVGAGVVAMVVPKTLESRRHSQGEQDRLEFRAKLEEMSRSSGRQTVQVEDAGAYVPGSGVPPPVPPAEGYPLLFSGDGDNTPAGPPPPLPPPPPLDGSAVAPAVPQGFEGPAGGVPPGLRDPSDPTPSSGIEAGSRWTPSGVGAGHGNTEAYAPVEETGFVRPQDAPLSTFSIDVDTASYANVRRYLISGQRPPPGAVRIEEMVNYFRYRYQPPRTGDPFAVHVEVASCPWNLERRLVKIGLKGREIDRRERPPSNLTFLLDVSGSMNEPTKLPLVKDSMRMLVREALDAGDKVSIVVYAGASGLVLAPTGGDRGAEILAAIDALTPGGSTNGAAGIALAYETNAAAFVKGGNNRVILCTDGDFNVGVTDRSQLLTLITEKAKSGIFLTVLGYGMGNLKDDTLELLADKGNGSYGYVDGIREARKVLVEEAMGTLFTIAKDVKIQVEFNPKQVAEYRLIGYDNRRLAAQDFADDKKDAGEIGAGHTVTALYEVVPVGKTTEGGTVEPLRYQRPGEPSDAAARNELLTVKLRFKQPDGDVSRLLEVPVTDAGATYEKASEDFKFAAAVTTFAMILRDSKFKGTGNLEAVQELAGEALGDDPGGYRKEFLDLVAKARVLGVR